MDTNESQPLSPAEAIARHYNFPLQEVQLAIGTEIEAPDLKTAHERYTLSDRNHNETWPYYRNELERWIGIELEKAKTPANFRFICMKTPEDFPEIVTVNTLWDRASRAEMDKKRKRPVSAAEAHRIWREARPTSREWFKAKDLFWKAFMRDKEAAMKKRDLKLLFELVTIAPHAEFRNNIERDISHHAQTEEDLKRTFSLIINKSYRAPVIRKLRDLDAWKKEEAKPR